MMFVTFLTPHLHHFFSSCLADRHNLFCVTSVGPEIAALIQVGCLIVCEKKTSAVVCGFAHVLSSARAFAVGCINS